MHYRIYRFMLMLGMVSSGIALENQFIPLGRLYSADITWLEDNIYKPRATQTMQTRQRIGASGRRTGSNQQRELPDDWERFLSDEDQDALSQLKESRKFIQDAVQEMIFFVLPSQMMKSPTFDPDDDISWAELADRIAMTVDLVRAIVESVLEAQFNVLAPQSTFMIKLRAAVLQLQNELVAIRVPVGNNNDGPQVDAQKAGVAGYNELIGLAKRLG